MSLMNNLEPDAAAAGPSLVAARDDLFDASRYDFFGDQIVEDVALGCLEDDWYNVDKSVRPMVDRERWFFSADREFVENVGAPSDIDDLASTFAKLRRTFSGSAHAGVIGDRRSLSGESSLTVDWTQESDIPNWLYKHLLNTGSINDDKRCWSQPHSSPRIAEPKPLHRTSSYQQQPHHTLNEPLLVSRTSLPSSMSLEGRCTVPKNLTRHASIPFQTASQAFFSPTILSQSGSPNHISQHVQSHMHGRLTDLCSSNISHNGWFQYNSLDHALSFPQSPHLLCQEKLGLLQTHPSFPPYAYVPPHLYYARSCQVTDKVVDTIPDSIDKRSTLSRKERQKNHYFQPFELTRNTRDCALPQFRSKYMSVEEIHGVLRIQNNPHNDDPYISDYYHQACTAKNLVGSNQEHFCPSSIKDRSSKSRVTSEPHPKFLVDTIGKVPSVDGILEKQFSVKPLEKEPIFAARVAIEDGFSLILNVDDIDRVLCSTQPQDGKFQLKRRRQVPLEEVAASLQLFDPFGPGKSGTMLKDDHVFLRILSIPKGQKLLSRYLQLLSPRSQIVRIICTAVFRHLRFLFGRSGSDSCAAETTVVDLAKTVSSCVNYMELSALSACLAAVVCSPGHPPLCLLCSSAGDGASLLIKSVLKRATALLGNSQSTTGSNQSAANRTLWQSSFDTFFALLTEYCFGKYKSNTLPLPPHPIYNDSYVVTVISKETPVELLRSSLPHTNEHQKKMLLDFCQRSTLSLLSA